MTATLSQIVADNVRAEMARRKITQSALAEKLGTSQALVYRRLSGRTAFDLDELGAIAQLLDMDPRELLPVGVPWAVPLPLVPAAS